MLILSKLWEVKEYLDSLLSFWYRFQCILSRFLASSLDIILMVDWRTRLVRISTYMLRSNTWKQITNLDAFTQMNNEPQIYGFLSLTMLSIAFFNFSGVSITKYMSATTRKVLDTLRTMVIWFCSMMFYFADERWGMPSFSWIFALELIILYFS